MRTCLIGLITLGLAGLANAQIVPTGPFAGSMFDDFESYPNYGVGGIYNSLPVMGGGATFNSNLNPNQLYIYQPGSASWGLGTYGAATVTSGARGLGLFNNSISINVTLNFATPVKEFGGYFATDSQQNGDLTLEFFDVNNVLLGSDMFDTGSNVMQWKGWTSLGNAISSIKFGNNIAPVMDDIRANPVPEPASLMILGAGALALLRRRRAK